MADYYPLIAKAVTGLDKSTGEARRALYERARNALVTQLRGVVPALSEQDITRERLALEEAIRKVEAEAARKARFDPPPERKRVDRPDRAELADPFASAAPGSGSAPRDPKSEETAPPAENDDDHPESTLSGTAADLRRPVRGPPPDRASLSNDGLKGFRNVVADAENLGDATAQASRSAREAYNAMPSPSPEFDRLEPRMEPEGLRSRDRRPAAREQRREPAQVREAREPRQPPSRDALARDPAAREPAPRDPVPREPAPRERGAPRERPQAPRERPSGRTAPPRPPSDDFDLEPRAESARDFSPHDFPPLPDFGPEPADDLDIPRARSRRRVEARPVEEEEEAPQPRVWLSGRLVAVLAVLALIAVVGGMVAWKWQPIVSSVRGFVSPFSQTASPASQPTTQPSRPKINDRIGAGDSAPAPQAAADVAQRVVLYEEDPDDPGGKRFVGSAVWRTEMVAPGAGQAPEKVVRADINLPERKMTMKWSLRRNADKTLPASHTVEVVFTLPQDFPHGGVQNVPGVLMKEAEQTRGVPLAGLAVKVTDGYFLIGLSAVDSEMQRNITLLKQRPWFDVPIVYTDGRRAILAVEKGTPGERAFNEAFAAWRQ